MSVIVVGNAAIDTTFEVERLPRPGESVLATAVREDLGGKGLNQAVAAARAGAEVAFHAAVGTDAAADRVERLLSAEGIPAAGLQRVAGATDRTTIFVTPDGQNAIVTAAQQAAAFATGMASAAVETSTAGDHVLLQGNLSLDATRAAAYAAGERGATVVINPSPIAFDYADLWRRTDIVVANEDETRSLGGAADTRLAASSLLEAGAGVVVVTRGERETLIVDSRGEWSLPVRPASAVDTTGAGDAFCGTFVAGLDASLDLPAAVERATAVAAVVVGRRGAIASFPSREEIGP